MAQTEYFGRIIPGVFENRCGFSFFLKSLLLVLYMGTLKEG
jgi:hypothetical protein